jgi:hypothetical protein
MQKIPPRTVFAAQATGILISWLVQTAVIDWALTNVKGICTSDAIGDVINPLLHNPEPLLNST